MFEDILTDSKWIERRGREYAMTVSELKEILQIIEEKGYGDYEVAMSYDSNYGYTTTNGNFTISNNTIWFDETE